MGAAAYNRGTKRIAAEADALMGAANARADRRALKDASDRPPPRTPKPAPRPSFAVGQRVYCKVHGAEGYHTVTAIGEAHHRGYIKITGERAWCPAHNFEIREES